MNRRDLLTALALLLPNVALARGRRRVAPNAGGRGRPRGGGGLAISGGGGRYFSSCREARAAGYSRIRRGQPGYSGNLDRDGDGIACE